jgi:hypothetical protein
MAVVFSGGSTKSEELMTELKTLREKEGSKETHTIMMLGVLFVSASATVQLGEYLAISTRRAKRIGRHIHIRYAPTGGFCLTTAPLNLHISQPLASNK